MTQAPPTRRSSDRRIAGIVVLAALVASCTDPSASDPGQGSIGPGRTGGTFADGSSPGVTGGAQATPAGPRNLSGTLDPTFVGGFEVAGLATDGQTAWATDRDRDVVVAIDLASGRVTGEYGVGGSPLGIAHAAGELWVANSSPGAHSVTRLDAATGQALGSIGIPAGRTPTGIAVGEGAAWVATSGSGELVRIDMTTGDVEATIADEDTSAAGTIDVVVAFASVWTVNTLTGSVVRIDPASNTITDRYTELGFVAGGVRGPLRLAVDATRVWVLSVVDRGHDATGLYSIDPATGSTTLEAEFQVAPDARGLPGLLIDSAGGAWFSVDERLVRFALAERRADTIEAGLALRFPAFVEAGERVWYGTTSSFDEDLAGLYGVELARILAP